MAEKMRQVLPPEAIPTNKSSVVVDEYTYNNYLKMPMVRSKTEEAYRKVVQLWLMDVCGGDGGVEVTVVRGDKTVLVVPAILTSAFGLSNTYDTEANEKRIGLGVTPIPAISRVDFKNTQLYSMVVGAARERAKNEIGFI